MHPEFLNALQQAEQHAEQQQWEEAASLTAAAIMLSKAEDWFRDSIETWRETSHALLKRWREFSIQAGDLEQAQQALSEQIDFCEHHPEPTHFIAELLCEKARLYTYADESKLAFEVLEDAIAGGGSRDHAFSDLHTAAQGIRRDLEGYIKVFRFGSSVHVRKHVFQ